MERVANQCLTKEKIKQSTSTTFTKCGEQFILLRTTFLIKDGVTAIFSHKM